MAKILSSERAAALRHLAGSAVVLALVAARPALAGPTLSTVATFNGSNGAYPAVGLVMDNSGNLYGTTNGGGASNAGTAFEVPAGSSTVQTLATFSATNGKYPFAGLLLSGSTLYGTTDSFGPNSYGTLFSISGTTLTTRVSFNSSNGANPHGSLVADANGNLYGTTYAGGANNDGIVYELPSGSNTPITMATFNNTNGKNPFSGATLYGGNLYGTTSSGGANNMGTVYEVVPGSNTVTTLATFNGTNGSNPSAGLIADAQGNLYGVADMGGANTDGTVFEVAAGSGTITTLATFNGTNGMYPNGALLVDAAGNLFGTTANGGTSSEGTVFEVAAGSATVTTLATFTGSNGNFPYFGSLIADNAGNLYGTTEYGGASGDGLVFEVSQSGFVAAPEPASLALVALGGMLILSARRKRQA
jgi:uncharacterized repeat protein (TIGR03803 family)